MSRLVMILLGAAALAVAAPCHAAGVQSPAISTSAAHAWMVKKSSPDFDRIRAFLLSRVVAARSYSASDLQPNALGDFTVRVSIHRSNGVIARNEIARLLVPSGGDYSAGDT